MHPRVKPIVARPRDSLRAVMERIDRAPHASPPAPGGIALIMERGRLRGIVTDGDIRRAILRGTRLTSPVAAIMTEKPLTVRWSAAAGTMLRDLHRAIQERGVPENRFHHVVATDSAGRIVDVVTPMELWKHSEMYVQTVAVIGLGYVGLTLALTIAEFGIIVIGVDTSRSIRSSLKKGIPHFFERGLPPLLAKHIGKTLTVKERLAPHESDIYILCVGTPVGRNGSIVTNHIVDAARNIGNVLKRHDLVILRSTVPIGATRALVIPLLEKTSGLRAGEDFLIAFAPERTVEGKALEELRTLPQVIGGINRASVDAAAQFFRMFAPTIIAVDTLEEAEAVKLLNNTFRDVSFAFANEAALLAAEHGISARRVIRAANEGYPRNTIPMPSPGVGGMCLVKDPHLLIASAKHGKHQPALPRLAREINGSMAAFVRRIVDRFARRSGHDRNMVIFLLGMTFKGNPETSDLRFSPSVDILRELQRTYRSIRIYDPVADHNELRALRAHVVRTVEEGFDSAHCVLVLTNNERFGAYDISSLARSMLPPALLFDPWGIYAREELSPLPDVQYATL